MAGYNNIVTENGKLIGPKNIDWALVAFGDTHETVEEMYGMIHYLAARLELVSPEDITKSHADIVEEARQNYRRGIRMSPGIQPEPMRLLNG